MNVFTLVFLLVLAAATAMRAWLAGRQIRHVQARREQVPAVFWDRVAPEQHRRAADYTAARTRLARVEVLYDAVLLLAWTLGGGLALVDAGWRVSPLPPLAAQTAAVVTVLLIAGLLALPFSIYRTFVVEAAFGFNRMTPRLFVSDTLKQAVLLCALFAPLAAAVLWLMHNAQTLWWLYAWAVWLAFSLGLTWAYPRFIAPLFNRFSPLEDPTLRERIEGLLVRCGFSSDGVFVMDGSRRSTHGNAYFTGVGDNKRIVFFDTLLQTLEPTEVEAVLAHELGHFRMHHVRKRLLASAGVALGAAALLGWLAEQSGFYQGLGVGQPSASAALLLFVMVGPTFAFVLQPLTAAWSRRHEFQADAYAAEHSDAGALLRALVKLYQENASTLTPDPIYSRVYDSHPPALERIAHLAQRTGTGPLQEVTP
ncbi:MAG: M48 family metallopeptidase [Gammaproteobacteria bacterium]|nr:M48 family metallopeptidase [Gammaproteobacteria bacterium]